MFLTTVMGGKHMAPRTTQPKIDVPVQVLYEGLADSKYRP